MNDYHRISEGILGEETVEKTNTELFLSLVGQYFPEAIKDGEVDFTALKEEMGEFPQVSSEHYEFTWAGKQAAKKEAQADLFGRTLKYKPEDSLNPDTTENLYIEGDNLEALKLLRRNYHGKIKMIYIDPPYNTGNDFVYRDNFSATDDEVDLLSGDVKDGVKLQKNAKDGAKYHTNWLNMMFPRLKVARELLKHNGVIFISIDDNEQSNLKKICDEIFGENSFVTDIHIQMSTVQGQKVRAAKAGNIVKNAEHILVYSKSGNKTIGTSPLLDPVKYDNHYNKFIARLNEDVYEEKNLSDIISENDTLIDELETLNLIAKGSRKISSNSIDVYYKYSNSFREFINDNAAYIVRAHDSVEVPEDFKDKMLEGLIYTYQSSDRSYLVVKAKNGQITQRIRLSEKIKIADDFYGTVGPTTIRGDWWSGFYLDMGNVSKEGDVLYNNGKKPIRLIRQLVEFCTEPDDIILDFFAGSATTAHAVMKLNCELKSKRKFIVIQLNEDMDETYNLATGSNKANIKQEIRFLDSIGKPHFVSEIGKERIRRAVKRLHNDNPNIDFDDGFKTFEISDSNLRWNTSDDNEIIALTKIDYSINDKDRIDFVRDFSDINVVYEIMLRQFDIPLSTPIEKLSSVSDRTYIFADAVVVCLEPDIDEKLIERLAAIEPTPAKYVLRDSAFNDDIELKDVSFRRLSALIANHQTEEERKSKYNNYTVEFI